MDPASLYLKVFATRMIVIDEGAQVYGTAFSSFPLIRREWKILFVCVYICIHVYVCMYIHTERRNLPLPAILLPFSRHVDLAGRQQGEGFVRRAGAKRGKARCRLMSR